MEAEDEESVVYNEKVAEKKSTEVKKNDGRGEGNQGKEKQIMVQEKEMEEQEKEKEIESEKMKKKKKIRLQRRVEVKKLWTKVWKYHILWYLPRRRKIIICRDF